MLLHLQRRRIRSRELVFEPSENSQLPEIFWILSIEYVRVLGYQ